MSMFSSLLTIKLESDIKCEGCKMREAEQQPLSLLTSMKSQRETG